MWHSKILNAYNILVGKPVGKYHLEGLRVCEKLTLKCIFKKLNRWVRTEVFSHGILTSRQTLVNTAMNLQVPQNAGNLLNSLETLTFSGRSLFLQFITVYTRAHHWFLS
jgi:predicted deacetylase